MTMFSLSWRLDCAGLFHFRHDLPAAARGFASWPGAAAAGPDPWTVPTTTPSQPMRQITSRNRHLTTPWAQGTRGLCDRRRRETPKSPSNKAWPGVGPYIRPIQVGPVSGRKAHRYWLSGVRGAEKDTVNMASGMAVL